MTEVISPSMAYSLGLGCNDGGKYMDYDGWWDPDCCRDECFTSTTAFEVHIMLYAYIRAGSRGGRGGGGSVGKKQVKETPTSALREEFFNEYSDDDFRDDHLDAEGSDDNYEDCSDSEGEDYIRNLRNLISLSVGPSTKFKKSRANRKPASKAVCLPYKFSKMKMFSLDAGPRTKSNKSRPKHIQISKAACLDNVPYICSKCRAPFAIKPEYLLHTAIIHKKCGACEYESQNDQKTDELWDPEHHFKSSQSCQYSSS